MIQIETIHVEEFRGIRNLTLRMNRNNFVISGPNGSGKSGIVDAIQFALSGEIRRLKGIGTGDLTLTSHGPHVETRTTPGTAFVRLDVYIPHLNKSASITRQIATPNRPSICPDDDDIKGVFERLENHPEMSLSRREIIKYIITEATQRSQDVQALLKLENIDRTRKLLKSTHNALEQSHSRAKNQEETAKLSLSRHLEIPQLTPDLLLDAVNRRRGILGLSAIANFTNETSIFDDITTEVGSGRCSNTKLSSIRDINALIDLVKIGLERSTKDEISTILNGIAELEENDDLLQLVQRHSLLQLGLDLIDGPPCPLCDTEWDVDALRNHILDKIKRSKEGQRIQAKLLGSGRAIAAQVATLRSLIDAVSKIDEASKVFIEKLGEWKGELQTFSQSLDSVAGMLMQKVRIESGWANPPLMLHKELSALIHEVKKRPEEDSAGNARDFLVIAQERLRSWQIACRGVEKESVAASRIRIAYQAYCEATEDVLTELYSAVDSDFSTYYRMLNYDDEDRFTATFEVSQGKLGLLVDFYGRGKFPPGAYHSEGHQDGMGVCLYLALMKQVFDKLFTFAVLDDVVMSVDSQHRKQFCRLLKSQFPDTQFIITTHDQIWTKQMRTEGLVSSKSAILFNKWTVETGPIFEEISDIWNQIDKDLAMNDIPCAAARLRRHLEWIAGELADELGAKVAYKGDGAYDMGELLSAVIGKQGELLKRAENVARSWGNDDEVAAIKAMRQTRSEILDAKGGEEWIINKAVHYNEWAEFSVEEFEPVVNTFHKLLSQFRCERGNCNSWLSLSPKVNPSDLRCACGSVRLNLRMK